MDNPPSTRKSSGQTASAPISHATKPSSPLRPQALPALASPDTLLHKFYYGLERHEVTAKSSLLPRPLPLQALTLEVVPKRSLPPHHLEMGIREAVPARTRT